jgi:hypothetical protein
MLMWEVSSHKTLTILMLLQRFNEMGQMKICKLMMGQREAVQYLPKETEKKHAKPQLG